MRKHCLIAPVTVLAIAFGLIAPLAHAVPMLSLIPSNSEVVNGQIANFDVLVSGVDEQFLGAYDLTLTWDAALLTLSDIQFDTFLDGPLDSISGFDSQLGRVNVYEVSLGTLAGQSALSSFRLFTLNYQSLAAGSSVIDFDLTAPLLLSSFAGETYGDVETIGSHITISSAPTAVPEPSSLLLFGVSLLGLAARRLRIPVFARERNSAVI